MKERKLGAAAVIRLAKKVERENLAQIDHLKNEIADFHRALVGKDEELDELRHAVERNALKAARLEGYIERVREIEVRNQAATPPIRCPDPIEELTRALVSDEQKANVILNALDNPAMDSLKNRVTGFNQFSREDIGPF